MLRVFVETSDKYLWCLKPFSYLFNTYWSSLQPVVVFGYSKPKFSLPSNFSFFSVDNVNYPPERWSDGVIRFLRSVDDEHFVLMLSDYFLIRTVDLRGVTACHEYVRERPEVLRIDLTADRLYAGGMRDVEGWGNYDIIETDENTPYQMSTQAGIWNRRRMLELLEPNKSAWEVEIHTHPVAPIRVLGTRQYIVRYANALLKGQLDTQQLSMMPKEHRNAIYNMIPKEYLNEH